jgi:putative salt-induced outer membrane protein YdiY
MRNVASSRASVGVVIAVLLGVASAASGDEIRFKNGDRLTGTITEAGGGKLKISSKVAGDVTVDLKDVETFTTDAPLDVRLKDGTEVHQRFDAGAAPGTVTAAAGPRREIALSDVKAITPKLGKWTGNIVAGGLLTRGNSHTTSLNLSAAATRRGEDDRISATAGYTFASQRDPDTGADSTSADAWFAAGKYDRFFTDEFYAYGLARADHDRIADLNLRLSPGVGVGYQWFEQPEFNFLTEAGISLMYEDYDPGPTDTHPAARLAYHVDRKFNERVTVFHNLAFLPSLEDISDFNVNADAGVRASLTKTMFTEFKVEWQYDATPAPDKDKNDLRYLLGLGWSF